MSDEQEVLTPDTAVGRRSGSIAKLAEALSKAQGIIEGAKKDSENPFFKKQYADLASVWGVCRKPLSDNGLSVVQLPSFNGGMVHVETILAHSSGEFISGCLSMTPVSDDPQKIGSCISYARRYALASIVGVFQEDDDANAASGKTKTEATRQTSTQAATTETTKEPEKGSVTGIITKVEPKKTKGDKPYAFVHIEGQKDAFSTFDTKAIPNLAILEKKTVTIEYSFNGKFKNITDFYVPQEKIDAPAWDGEEPPSTDDDRLPF